MQKVKTILSYVKQDSVPEKNTEGNTILLKSQDSHLYRQNLVGPLSLLSKNFPLDFVRA